MSVVPTESASKEAAADWSKTGCPICGSKAVEDYFTVPSIPVDSGAWYPSAEEARHAPVGRICLAVCHDCGYIGNRTFEYSHISFGARYDVSLHHSPSFQAFLEKTARRLVDGYRIRNKTILEIGCGSGHFLQLICQAGDNDGIGIDPSVPREGTEPCGTRSLTFIRDLYSDKYSHFDADLICCLQMYCLIADPLGFLKMVRRNIGERNNTVVYLEVPNAEYALDGPVRWNVSFEYASIFSPTSLRRTFVNAGFLVRDCQPCYEDGQYMYIDAVPDPDYKEREIKVDVVSQRFLDKITNFSNRYAEVEAMWQKKIEELRRSGKKVAGWGAGYRAVFFMNRFDTGKLIPFVVDINPNRQNAYLPGTGQKIVPPEFLLSYKPDVIIITHSTYVAEITSQVRGMGLQSEILPI